MLGIIVKTHVSSIIMNGNHEFIHIPLIDSQECTLGFNIWSLDPRLMLADNSDICAILLH